MNSKELQVSNDAGSKVPTLENKFSKSFEKFFAEECVPVRPKEKIKPTRVVWLAQGGFYTGRVFPTEERAYAFASDLLETGIKGVQVQNPTDPFPKQTRAVNQKFVQSGIKLAKQKKRFREKI